MKKTTKLIATLFFIVTIISCSLIPVFAASGPAAVKNLKASSASYNSVKLSWSKASNANKYYIQKSTNKKNWSNVTNVKGTSYTVTKLTTGTTYYFRVRGYRNLNRKYGAYSNVTSAKPMPVQVTGLKVSSTTPVSAKLTWTKVAGATGYEIFNGSKKLATVKTNSGTVSGLTPNSTVKLKVRAYTTVSKKNQYGAYSAQVSAKTTIAKVSGLKATQATPVSATLTWTKIAGVTGYEVYNNGKKVTTVKTNKATVSSLVPGNANKFTVKAYVTVGKKTYYGAVSAAVSLKTAVDAASGLKITQATPVSATASWTALKQTQGYYLQQYDAATKKWVNIKTISKAATTSATISNLVPNTTYKFRLQPYYKTYTGKVSATVSFKPVIAPVTNLSANGITGKTAVLNWTGSTTAQVEGYRIYKDDVLVGNLAYGVNSAAFDDLEEGTTYHFKVETYYKTYSSSATITVATTPAQPTGVKFESGTTSSATISWDASKGADGYYVYLDGEKVGDSKEATFTITNVSSSKLHYVNVAAYTNKNASETLSGVSENVPFFLLANVTFSDSYIYDLEGFGYQYVSARWSVSTTVDQSFKYTYFVDDDYENEVNTQTLSGFKYITTKKDETKSVTVSQTSDGYTDIKWDAFDDADGYLVQVAGTKVEKGADAWATVFNSATGTDSKSALSTRIIVPDNMPTKVRVVAYNRHLTIRANIVKGNETTDIVCSNTLKVSAPGSVALSDEFVNEANYNTSTNMGKTKIVLAAVQAINNTKGDPNTNLRLTAKTTTNSDLDKSYISATRIGWFDEKSDETIDLTTFLGLVKNLPGLSDILDEMTESMNESSTLSGVFRNGTGSGTITYSDGKTANTGTTSLKNVISPAGDHAYLYNANDVASIAKKVTSVSAPKVENGVTTISFTLVQEKATADKPDTPVHNGFMDGLSDSVESLTEMDSSAHVVMKGATVTAAINADGTLNSLKMTSPFEFKMTMDLEDTEIEVLGVKRILHMATMILNGTAVYDYSFTRAQ